MERIRYSIGDDWSGDPAIFFRVVLSDEAQQQRELLPLTEQVRAAILDEVQPYEKDCSLYFNYRTLSDQQELRDKAWD
ncbi:MAG: hypothetical protein H6509_12075 [Bryobacterales bacterium]|nr:hypothetical protein [Bryobacterales bacterium]